MATWIKYYGGTKVPKIIDLEQAMSFSLCENKTSVWVHYQGGGWEITEKYDPEVFQWLLEYIKTETGQTLA
jgi:hypothetical protein